MSQKVNTISYDDIPYPPFTFRYTNPEHLKTIGKLFGTNPPLLKNARILDIGCGVGVNIFNFAEMYPESYSIGVDLSRTQIDQGLKAVKDLNLKNVELKALSILDIDESFGNFDYIIAHGVFSWIPQEVQEKILEICNKLLNPNGIAFVSYNTLPGWNMQSTIREMMMFHSELFDNNHDKLQQAKLMLNFINESLADSTVPYSNFLRDESKMLLLQDNSYILHEYLGDINTGIYFNQFMDMAHKKQLSYLGDSSLSSMFVGNLPVKAVEKLQEIGDIIRTEQYMDFITNRKFRTTLLCHNTTTINRTIEFDKLKDFYTVFNIRPIIAEEKVDLTNEQENVSFYYRNLPEPFISTTSPLLKAILYVYSENSGNPVTLEEVAKAALRKLGKFQLKDFLTTLEAHFVKFIFQGYVEIFESKPNAINNITAKPEASEFARYQAAQSNFNHLTRVSFVTNRLNEVISIEIHEKYILELLDGTNDILQIKHRILQKFISQELHAFDDKQQEIRDEKLLKEFTDHIVATTLEKFCINYLLIG